VKPDNVERLKQLYDLFNAREIDAVLAMLHRDVLWANGMEGGHVRGHDGIRDYWTRQWSKIDPHVEPVRFSTDADNRTEVDVHQIVRDLEGNLLSDKRVRHVFEFDDDLIRRFDIG
jgi:nuclear transport factor 2 (NTF2) superfamily protein